MILIPVGLQPHLRFGAVQIMLEKCQSEQVRGSDLVVVSLWWRWESMMWSVSAISSNQAIAWYLQHLNGWILQGFAADHCHQWTTCSWASCQGSPPETNHDELLYCAKPGSVRNTCLWFTFFPCFTPLLPPFFQPIPMDYISLYPLFINPNAPPIVCPMHPSSDSSLSLCDRCVTILFYLYTGPQRRLVPFYFADPFSHPYLPTGWSPSLSNP